jgi:RNA polymerase sigma-70 factor, ECF subfamily
VHLHTAEVEPELKMAAFSDQAVTELFNRHKNELRLHCYRMLGSSHDTDDVLQEAAVRAWRSKASLLEPAHGRAWLYRIATNVCLDELERRRSRCLPFEAGPPTAKVDLASARAERESWIEPCPDAWRAGVTADPEARYQTREGVTLAFVAALQHLTAAQRATLLLRDVVGLSAEETAQALELSLEATNSALFRARRAVETKLQGNPPSQLAPPSTAVVGLLSRYLAAWNEMQVDAFIALLHDEVRTTMPPFPMWIAGRADNVAFYRPMFAAQRPGSFRAVLTAANGGPAFAFYRAPSPAEPLRLRAIQLVELRDQLVVSIDHFVLPELGPVFGLADELEGDGAQFPSGEESHLQDCLADNAKERPEQ